MYSFTIDEFDLEHWDNYSTEFSGMNIYQTGLYGRLHSMGFGRSCSRVALFKDNYICALAQLRIKRVPLTAYGVAEVDWGPLWHNDRESPDYDGLGMLLDVLRTEYTEKRGLQLRIRPYSTFSSERDAELQDCFKRHGFLLNKAVRPYHTVIIDLHEPLNLIRSNFHQKWRNQLNVSERADLAHECGSSNEHFERFYAIYRAMWRQKKFLTGVRLPVIKELHTMLPDNAKFLITILRDGNTDIGATVCSAQGNTLMYFLGATLPGQRDDSRPGYLLQWLHIQMGKELGMRWYDLGGYNDDNQAIARFKKRTNGALVVFPGQFETETKKQIGVVYKIGEGVYRKARRMLMGS